MKFKSLMFTRRGFVLLLLFPMLLSPNFFTRLSWRLAFIRNEARITSSRSFVFFYFIDFHVWCLWVNFNFFNFNFCTTRCRGQEKKKITRWTCTELKRERHASRSDVRAGLRRSGIPTPQLSSRITHAPRLSEAHLPRYRHPPLGGATRSGAFLPHYLPPLTLLRLPPPLPV